MNKLFFVFLMFLGGNVWAGDCNPSGPQNECDNSPAIRYCWNYETAEECDSRYPDWAGGTTIYCYQNETLEACQARTSAPSEGYNPSGPQDEEAPPSRQCLPQETADECNSRYPQRN